MAKGGLFGGEAEGRKREAQHGEDDHQDNADHDPLVIAVGIPFGELLLLTLLGCRTVVGGIEGRRRGCGGWGRWRSRGRVSRQCGCGAR